MELLGKSLGNIFTDDSNTMPVEIVIDYTRQMLAGITELHRVGFLHRDVKPNNFALGLDGTTVYMLDFGLARRFKDINGEIIPPRPIASFQVRFQFKDNFNFRVLLGYNHIRINKCSQSARNGTARRFMVPIIYFNSSGNRFTTMVE